MSRRGATELEQYVNLLEEARNSRGLGGGVLSPADWRRLERWFRAGIPVGWVLEYLDLATGNRTFTGKAPWRSIERHLVEAWEVVCSYPPVSNR